MKTINLFTCSYCIYCKYCYDFLLFNLLQTFCSPNEFAYPLNFLVLSIDACSVKMNNIKSIHPVFIHHYRYFIF